MRISFTIMRSRISSVWPWSPATVLAMGMAGVYITLVCLAATCGFMPAHEGASHAHHAAASVKGTHAGHAHASTQGDEPSAPQSAVHSLCAWACQAGAPSALGVAPLGSPLLMAQATVESPDQSPSTSLFSEFPSVRGPPL